MVFLVVPIAGCTLAHHEVVPAVLPVAAVPPTWDEVLAQPGPLVLTLTVSATGDGPLGGMLDVRDPVAREAGVRRTRIASALPVAVLVHPELGTWVVDTGICAEMARGEKGPFRGPLRWVAGKRLRPGPPLGALVAPDAVSGVLLTHLHFDHVMGLPDVPDDVPVYTGAGEIAGRTLTNLAMRPVVQRVLRDRAPLRELPRPAADLRTPAGAIDLLGDGSLWAVPTPGHTAGHTSYLALTTGGPVLFAGDASHTRWGWDHGVAPGWFTDDDERGAESLRELRALVAAHPEIRVEVGHEAPGADAVTAAIRPGR